jgi:hypothetical protein
MNQSIAALLPYDIVLEATQENVAAHRRRDRKETRSFEVHDRTYLLTNRVLDLRDLESGELLKVRPSTHAADHARSTHPAIDEGADFLTYLNPSVRQGNLVVLLKRYEEAIVVHHEEGAVRLEVAPLRTVKAKKLRPGLEVVLSPEHNYLPQKIRVRSYHRREWRDVAVIENELALTEDGLAYPVSGKGTWVSNTIENATFSFKLDRERSQFGELDMNEYVKARKETGEGRTRAGWLVWTVSEEAEVPREESEE